MGDLYYGTARTRIHIDDRVLFHLRAVITAKFRRNEGFLMSWRDANEIGDGRSSVWLHSNTDLHYKFDGGRAPELDRELIERMSLAANSAVGSSRVDLQACKLEYSIVSPK